MREPYEHGRLEVGDGHEVYWERCGTPGAKPVVVLHGGPGAGCSAGMRGVLDPARYDLVLFDQRGAGRSRPHAGAALADLAANTTHHLVADIERLRRHLGIERWLVVGLSWGTTLALAYAEAHPERVSETILVAVTTTTPREVQWITRDVGRLFPEEWARFRDGVPAADRDGDLCAAYSRLLHDWRHGAWIEPGALLAGVPGLAAIPAVLIHGRRDVSSPLDVPWALAAAWPGSELVVVDEGHRGGTEMNAAIAAAGERFAG